MRWRVYRITWDLISWDNLASELFWCLFGARVQIYRMGLKDSEFCCDGICSFQSIEKGLWQRPYRVDWEEPTKETSSINPLDQSPALRSSITRWQLSCPWSILIHVSVDSHATFPKKNPGRQVSILFLHYSHMCVDPILRIEGVEIYISRFGKINVQGCHSGSC